MSTRNYHSLKVILSFLMITLSVVTKGIEAGRDRGARCENPDYIANGNYRLRRERVMRITCNFGFQLQGPKTIDCVRGKWDGEKPVCAKKGCQKKLEQPDNGRIQIENDVKAILYCSDNYNLAGNRHSFCNGTNWDRPIGNCRERKNKVQHECDFETDDICGWTYEPREGLEWKRVMAANVFTTFKTGPRHDHTTLTANGGHYMLMESLTQNNDLVTLTSPIYDRGLSLKTACCFQFYYFMYGAGVGDLFVVIKPVSVTLDELFKNNLKNRKELIKFQKFGNQNNIWNEAHFNIEELDEDFQILFVAKSGRGQLSDIAVDDVRLLMGDDCKSLDKKEDEDQSNEEYDSTTYESIYEIQSCVGRCFDNTGSGIIRTSGHLKGLCNCDIDCEDNDACCPDFKIVCLNDLFTETSMLPLNTDYATHEIQATTTTTPATTSTTVNSTTTIITTAKAVKTTPTTIKTTPTTTTVKTTPTTQKTTVVKTTSTTTPKTTTKTTTKTTPKTTTKTTPKTTTKTTPKTTSKTTPKTTTKTTPKTTSKTTPRTAPTTLSTTIETTKTTSTTTTATTTTPKTTTTTTKTTTTSKATTKEHNTTKNPAANPKVLTPTQKSIPKSTEYIINGNTHSEVAHKGSGFLLYTFVVIVIIILAAAVYRRFGDSAVVWYMIHFRKNNTDNEDTSSVAASFKRQTSNCSDTQKNLKTKSRRKAKKSMGTKSLMKTPLVDEDDEDDDDDDDIGHNGNIALKNNIYSEL